MGSHLHKDCNFETKSRSDPHLTDLKRSTVVSKGDI